MSTTGCEYATAGGVEVVAPAVAVQADEGPRRPCDSCHEIEVLRCEFRANQRATDDRIDRVIRRIERNEDHMQALERLVLELKSMTLGIVEDLGAVKGMLSIIVPRVESIADAVDREGDRVSTIDAKIDARPRSLASAMPQAIEAAGKAGRLGWLAVGALLMLASLALLVPYVLPLLRP